MTMLMLIAPTPITGKYEQPFLCSILFRLDICHVFSSSPVSKIAFTPRDVIPRLAPAPAVASQCGVLKKLQTQWRERAILSSAVSQNTSFTERNVQFPSHIRLCLQSKQTSLSIIEDHFSQMTFYASTASETFLFKFCTLNSTLLETKS